MSAQQDVGQRTLVFCPRAVFFDAARDDAA
jgi:hypothetical protein